MPPNHVYGKLFYGYTVMTTGTELALRGGGLEVGSLSSVDVLSCFLFFSFYILMPQKITLVIPKISSAPDGDKAGQSNGIVSFSP